MTGMKIVTVVLKNLILSKELKNLNQNTQLPKKVNFKKQKTQ